MNKAFQKWKKRVRHEQDEQEGGGKDGDERIEKEKTYGIKRWGKVRTIPRIHKQIKNFLQMGIG
eukprot:698329-Pleurochrysis_carterae.AAC.1